MLNFSCVVFCFYDIVFMFLSFFIHFKILFSILFFHIVLSQHLFSFYLILNHFDTNFNSFITISEFSDTLLKFWGIDLSFGALSAIFLNIIFTSWSRIPWYNFGAVCVFKNRNHLWLEKNHYTWLQNEQIGFGIVLFL